MNGPGVVIPKVLRINRLDSPWRRGGGGIVLGNLYQGSGVM